jgi:hypothetical protein
MSKLVLTASLLAVLAIAACSPAAAAPSGVPSIPPGPTAPPSAEPPPSDAPETPEPAPTPTPPARPAPDPTDPPETPDPAIVEFTADEMHLVDGIRRGAAMDCEPVRGELPTKAIAGVECIGGEWFVARLGFYLFENDEEMLEHYTARMQAEGVTFDQGSCFDGEGDGQYIPGDEEVMSRNGCFITAEGVANYRLLLPGAHVYVGIVGHNIDTIELADFAFLGGTRDTPSFPTIWGNAGA